MSTFGFRIKFLLLENSFIGLDESITDIMLPLESKGINFKLQSMSKPSEAASFAFFGTGFDSEQDAFEAGKNVKNALMLCSTRLHIGIDLGKDNATSGVGQSIIEQERERGVNLVNDIHGLVVFNADMPVEFVAGGKTTMSLKYSAKNFFKEFEFAYKLSRKFTDKQILAVELYNQSFFEDTLRARFLTLISAIECLAVAEKVSATTIALLDEFIASAKIKIGNNATDERTDIVNRLGYLKNESISSACRKTIKKYKGAEYVKRFGYLYGLRSDLVHRGAISQSVDFGKCLDELEAITSTVLYNSLTSEENAS